MTHSNIPEHVFRIIGYGVRLKEFNDLTNERYLRYGEDVYKLMHLRALQITACKQS